MSPHWRTAAVLLGLVCAYQTYRSYTRPTIDATTACHETVDDDVAASDASSSSSRSRKSDKRSASITPTDDDTGDEPPADISYYGIKVPPFARSLLPQPGENLRDYRDRMLPLAQMAVAPHRDRLERSIDDLTKVAGLDPSQREALQTTAAETAEAMQDRVFEAVLSGELNPSTFKPMAGVHVARDVLDILDKGNQKFVGSLREDQRTALAGHPFDFADYLVFSTRWEDTISRL